MNCKCCGAPLHGSKCDYCGAEYENPVKTIQYRVDTYDHAIETLACRVNVPMEYMHEDTKEMIEKKIKNDMAYQLSKGLLDYMDVETWIDPASLTQCFGGRVRVARPD